TSPSSERNPTPLCDPYFLHLPIRAFLPRASALPAQRLVRHPCRTCGEYSTGLRWKQPRLMQTVGEVHYIFLDNLFGPIRSDDRRSKRFFSLGGELRGEQRPGRSLRSAPLDEPGKLGLIP